MHTPNGSALLLTSHESLLLQLLLANPGKNVCYQEIFAALCQPNDRFGKARLEVLITRLRAKVARTDPAATLPIKARRNIGYVFLCTLDLI
nr:helix-turn-helix domain-containing protein [Trichlorobacter sp.]